MVRRKKQNAEHEEESFFVSMTDIMVGLLFIFLIIIVYFSYQLKKEYRATESYAETAQRQGTRILSAIEKILSRKGIKVEIDKKQGILRLPDGVLFDSGQSNIPNPSEAYDAALEVSEAFYKVLKCSVFIKDDSKVLGQSFYRFKGSDCYLGNAEGAFVDSIFIEGHTDNEPFRIGNLRLSANRGTNTYELMTKHTELRSFYSPDQKEIFGVSAFGDTRPIKPNDSLQNKKANRRIDIRLIMYVPRSKKTLNEFKKRLCNELNYSKYCS
jgi:chemotaxis protein MotB